MPPTRKSADPMCEPSSAPSRLRAIRRKSEAFILQILEVSQKRVSAKISPRSALPISPGARFFAKEKTLPPSRSIRQVSRDHLPSLRPFLTDQRRANCFGLRAGRFNYAHQNRSITKHSNDGFARSRTRESAWLCRLRNDVILAQQTSVKTAADEIIGNHPSKRN